MSTFEEMLSEWRGLMRTKQPYVPTRLGMLGDGNGNVAVGSTLPGWSWIRYDSNPHKIATVLNRYEHWAEDTRVVVGKVHPNDPYEQVIGLDIAFYSQHMEDAWMAYMFTPPHGETHLSTEIDPAYIDTGNVVDGRVRAIHPVTLNVYVEPFLYPRNCLILKFEGGLIDLTSYVPGIGLYGNLHCYVLIYLDIATGTLGAIQGDTYYTEFTPVVPDAIKNTVPLGMVLLTTGQTSISKPHIYPYKIIWHPLCENVPIHAHTDDSSGGSSLLGIEEFTFAAATTLLVQLNRIYPTQVYHSLWIDPMYPVGSHELHWIEPDPLHGEGQIIILRLAQAMYGSYSVVLRHGLGNLYLPEGDIIISRPTDHILLMYNGAYWCPLKIVMPGGGGGGAPTNSQYVVMAVDPILTDERVLTAGSHLQLVDGGAGGAATLNVISVPNHQHTVAAGDGGEVPLASIGGFVQGRLIRGGAVDWEALDASGAGFIVAGDGVNVQSQMTTDGQIANRVIRTDVNKGIRPARLGIAAAVPDQDGVIALAEVAVDPTNVAGIGMIYVKDDAGFTRAYLMRDNGNIFQIGLVLVDVTVTVKPGGGGDFTVIQDAIEWFKNGIIYGSCHIVCDAGAYDEKLDFSGLLIAAGSNLYLDGDMRTLASLTYVHGAKGNPVGLANGGNGTVTLTNAGNDITVSCSMGNPNLAADGWGNGDEILIYRDTLTPAVYTINAVVGNVITLTVAAPNVGLDGTAVMLIADRAIKPSATGYCIVTYGVRDVVLRGWYLRPFTGSIARGIGALDGAYLYVAGVGIWAEDYGVFVGGDSGVATSSLFSPRTFSCWADNAACYNAVASIRSLLNAPYIHCVWGAVGVQIQYSSVGYVSGSVAARATSGGFKAILQSSVYCTGSQTRSNANGFVSASNSLVYANDTIAWAANLGNDYVPNPAGANQYAEDVSNFGVLFKS